MTYEQKEMERAPKTYRELKTKHPDAVLLFRVGDFYEMYCEDAATCADILGITLNFAGVARGERPAGVYRIACFPFHALDIYLPKLVRAGKRVAICDNNY